MLKPIKTLFHLSSRIRRVAFIVVAVLILAGAIAYASIPDANGVVHGCYNKSGGSLRVIDSAIEQCDKNETLLTWNQTGAQGLQGPPGPQGPEGPPGQSGQLTTYSGSALTFIPCNSVEETAPVHSVPFTKATSTSRLRIGYSDVANIQLGVDETFNLPWVEMKIDGAQISPVPMRMRFLRQDEDTACCTYEMAKQFSIFGYAENVSAGSHTLTVTYRFDNGFPPSSGRRCYRGSPYPITRTDPFQIEIEEIP